VTHFFPKLADDHERELFDRVGHYDDRRDLDSLTPERLREITAVEGCDFATLLLHRAIVESDAHQPFLRGLGKGTEMSSRDVTVAIVPGAFFRENPRTGADGRVIREVALQLGLPVTLIPVSSTGSVTENARIIAEWLLARRDEVCILVSVSKGGSDLKTAFARPDAARVFKHVAGWINLCGILDGTPMADWLLSADWLARANRFVYRIRGRSLDFLSDLGCYTGSALDRPLVLPANVRAFHVLGFPLRHHLKNGLVRRCHDRLASLGPNDGSILLAGALQWPGQLCPVWGADHYLDPQIDVRPLLAALLRVVAARDSVALAS
jgi:hypothetical protein